MTSSVKSVTKTTRVVNNRTGVTTSTTVSKKGNATTVTRTTTIGKAKPVTSSKKSAATPAKATGAVLDSARWITGPNDTRDLCGPVAVANALYAVTGVEASSAAIERMYRAAGGIGDTGVPIPACLAQAGSYGLAGCRLAGWDRTLDLAAAGVALMELPGIPDAHAAAITPGGFAVMWGTEMPLASLGAVILGAWTLTWHGTE